MRYMIHLSYDGTKYSGWQRQGNSGQTISGKLENVLSVLDGTPVRVQGAGRTDAGVHALDQTATFDLAGGASPEEVMRAFGRFLPEDIAVLSCERVSARFHARLNAVGKIYRYTVRTDEVRDVFHRRYQWHLGKKLDTVSMDKAARMLVGTHDYRAFCTNASSRHSTVRTVKRIDIEENSGCVVLEYEGNGFLYNMVRIMTGTLCEIGLGKRAPEEIPAIIASRDRGRAGITAPAEGLMLVRVLYGTGKEAVVRNS